MRQVQQENKNNDPSQGKDQEACRTQKLVEAWRLGILGSLITGLNTGWLSRARANLAKIITGVLQLTTAIVIARACKDIFTKNRYAAVVGALFA